MNKLPARTGLEWLKQGFALFRVQPGILMMLIVANFLFAILLSALPILGPILSFVFIPSFTIAIQQTCHLIDNGQRVLPGVLLTGFRKDAIGPLCKMGLVYLAILVLLILLVSPWIDVESVRNAMKMVEAKKEPTLDSGTQFAALAFMAMFGISMLLLSFAPGLIYWKKMPTFKAIFYSVFAVFGSVRPLLAMLFSALGFYWIISMVIGLIFGRSQIVFVIIAWLNLVFALVFQCAIFAAYKQILGAPESASEKPN
ncbi:MAG: BPSS1780 family membrane protein [Pseudomonadota bacterium]